MYADGTFDCPGRMFRYVVSISSGTRVNTQTDTTPTRPPVISTDDCGLIDLPKIHDPRGNLTFIESGRHVPFEIERALTNQSSASSSPSASLRIESPWTSIGKQCESASRQPISPPRSTGISISSTGDDIREAHAS
jgi:hypothetical protein